MEDIIQNTMTNTMTINHHPDDATLLSFSAGSLPVNLAIVVSCHLPFCKQCKQRIIQAERIGGEIFDKVTPIDLPEKVKDQVMERLSTSSSKAQREIVENDFRRNKFSEVPLPLQRFVGDSFDNLNWKYLVPGLKQVKVDIGEEGNIRLLKISPGTCMPLHSHHGSELTLVLKGSYNDEIGCFKAGDIADTDSDIEHQPIANSNEDCICLIATDAPLKFKGIISRLLQPFFGL